MRSLYWFFRKRSEEKKRVHCYYSNYWALKFASVQLIFDCFIYYCNSCRFLAFSYCYFSLISFDFSDSEVQIYVKQHSVLRLGFWVYRFDFIDRQPYKLISWIYIQTRHIHHKTPKKCSLRTSIRCVRMHKTLYVCFHS